jgi:hypothetical protein
MPLIARAIQFLDGSLGIVMMNGLPGGPWFHHIIGFHTVTDQVSQFVELALDPVALVVGVGPQLGSR